MKIHLANKTCLFQLTFKKEYQKET